MNCYAVYNFCNVDPAFDPSLGCSFDPVAPRVNARMITQNYLLHAAFVEKVLSQNLAVLGVDVTKPTAVILNWWGRSDYVDHIYLDPSEPDPETGIPRGLFFANELAGYGATSHTDPCFSSRLSCRTNAPGVAGALGAGAGRVIVVVIGTPLPKGARARPGSDGPRPGPPPILYHRPL